MTALSALLAKHGPAPFTNTLQLLDVLKSIPAEYPPGLLAARRIAFLRQIEAHNEGSDTSMSAQNEEAGFGSFGPM